MSKYIYIYAYFFLVKDKISFCFSSSILSVSLEFRNFLLLSHLALNWLINNVKDLTSHEDLAAIVEHKDKIWHGGQMLFFIVLRSTFSLHDSSKIYSCKFPNEMEEKIHIKEYE